MLELVITDASLAMRERVYDKTIKVSVQDEVLGVGEEDEVFAARVWGFKRIQDT